MIDWRWFAGSPPRVRSRPAATFRAPRTRRITSACAEQTAGQSAWLAHFRDHLRVCGADQSACSMPIEVRGSPPRVRSRPAAWSWSDGRSGSPPRVRSRRPGRRRHNRRHGITSACAEQTPPFMTPQGSPRDHLRVCGADVLGNQLRRFTLGSPPRVRSRHVVHGLQVQRIGITSACAEQTLFGSTSATWQRDHLRVCGADAGWIVAAGVAAGSPPRVRSRPDRHRQQGCRSGITSACAKQTFDSSTRRRAIWDHLRVCGADLVSAMRCGGPGGSPPRVRSRPHVMDDDVTRGGITSACAEQTQSGARWSG